MFYTIAFVLLCLTGQIVFTPLLLVVKGIESLFSKIK